MTDDLNSMLSTSEHIGIATWRDVVGAAVRIGRTTACYLNTRWPRLLWNPVLKLNHRCWVGGVVRGSAIAGVAVNGRPAPDAFAFARVLGFGVVVCHCPSRRPLRRVRRWGRIRIRMK